MKQQKPSKRLGAITDDATVVSDAERRLSMRSKVETDLTSSISFTSVERSGTSSGKTMRFRSPSGKRSSLALRMIYSI